MRSSLPAIFTAIFCITARKISLVMSLKRSSGMVKVCSLSRAAEDSARGKFKFVIGVDEAGAFSSSLVVIIDSDFILKIAFSQLCFR
jgi:hypothetical protein